MTNHFDAIVIGAGPAGSTAALTLARQGVKTALLERGEKPGDKNVFGGTIYSIPTRKYYPHFLEEVSLERRIVKEAFHILDKDSSVQIGFTGLHFNQPPYNKFSIKRAHLDPYLAQKAMDEGASLYTEALVTEIMKKKNKVVGVQINHKDQLLAPAVIITEGVIASLSQREGLHPPHPPKDFTLYVKEVLGLEKEKIEDRFQLESGEGAIIGMIGYPLAKVMGKAAIWTEKEALSLIVGAHLDDLVEKGVKLQDLLYEWKKHPLVKRLLKNTKPLEYQGHMIPKGGLRAMPGLYQNGILVAGDAATMISGRRGTDLAMISGDLASETLINALFQGDLSAKSLSNYKKKLDKTFFLEDIKGEKKKIAFKEKHPDSEHLLSVALNKVAYDFFQTSFQSKREKESSILEYLKTLQPPLKSFQDVISMARDWEAF